MISTRTLTISLVGWLVVEHEQNQDRINRFLFSLKNLWLPGYSQSGRITTTNHIVERALTSTVTILVH
ncbi:hypothetical protein DERP_004929 [Dermatophagoides pteronyssinus]|uniref:Uncharacterized protein n=1 Tax=Dermatophagoides pteronyssinus TaxID=6956 RepID=A0ABQ8JTZ6_DERPT|nr:hypothetical protein DERP_004929 [Dermatophagoides pteronyssinus]